MQNKISDYTDRIVRPVQPSDPTSGLPSSTALVRENTGYTFSPGHTLRFISLTDLDAAIHEACEAYGLCEDGRDDMRRSLGIIPNVREVLHRIRVDDLAVKYTVQGDGDISGILASSDIDRIIVAALDAELPKLLAERNATRVTDVDARADCYWGDVEDDE
jgi:hypothetical protein